MRIDIMTLFPDAVEAMMGSSIIGRARERGFVTIQTHQIRDYTTNKQMQVDDYPYGGGRGAVMQADPLYRCWQHICDEAGERVHTIYMSPCGRAIPPGGSTGDTPKGRSSGSRRCSSSPPAGRRGPCGTGSPPEPWRVSRRR